MSELPTFSMRQLLDAGVHFGHKTMRWNPKMASYIYGARDDIHIIDLQQTVPLLYRALEVVKDVVKNNGKVLFVGTKKQASDIVADAAKRCGQYYINHRWLGGLLTNWSTVSQSIKTLTDLEKKIDHDNDNEENHLSLTKKELLELSRKKEKLDRSLGGIREMGGRPDLLFIIDTNKESLAIQEAKKLNIPVIAVLDSNSDPDDINYPIPGNDDATRAIKLYCKLISDAALSGIQASLTASGVDIGELEEGIGEATDEESSEVESKAKEEKKKTTTTVKKKTTTKAPLEKKTTTTKKTSSKKTSTEDEA
jgi:small subunit ribosomal protein S2